MMTTVYHVDGSLVAAEEARVSVDDRGFRFGDAACQQLRVYGDEPFCLESHLERLEESCASLGFSRAMPPADDLASRLSATIEANDFGDCLATISVTRGVQSGDVTPDPRVAPTVLITVEQLPRGGVTGDSTWAEPASVAMAQRPAVPDQLVPSRARTHSRVHGVLARQELAESATDEPPDEAILCDSSGLVVSGVDSSVFFVEAGTVHTPSLRLPVYPEVTRDVVCELVREESVPLEMGRYRPSDVRSADEVFLTNPRWEIRPVTNFDGRRLETGPLTELLGRLFDEEVEQRCY